MVKQADSSSQERNSAGKKNLSKNEGKKNVKGIKTLSAERLRQLIPQVTNKNRRRDFASRLRTLVKQERTKRRRSRQAAESRGEVVEKQTPHTIETLRRADETIVEAEDQEILEADETDEFSKYFQGKSTPKILLTTCKKPSRCLLEFVKELQIIIPNVFYYKRGDYRIKSIVKYGINKEFTDIIVLAEHLKRPSGMYISHLPEGPTSFFKLTNVKLAQEMKGSAAVTTHQPEVILNGFTTRLGRRAARQLAVLFPQRPEFHGRRAICFHNQRDFIFFRHHRYIFSEGGRKCRLQEIGPRMTLKLRSMQHGTFDPSGGLFEFEWKPDMQVDRKKMFV
ncbi:brix domain-containing protein F44G4.1-like [Condylostylus longicornis]|uniref:brix domain-containing protein F44G4.1-like n=1 Tax=Condylostylus longicornis TaxID=2530218 RepID=UPI00244DC9C5|nr:brix domain-containing protein F44G4.1-like [Condylostylus longicornis]